METDGNPDEDGADFLLTDSGNDVDLRLARLEALADRRPALLSAVMLRQNPHNVAEWHKRVKLFTGDPTKQVCVCVCVLCARKANVCTYVRICVHACLGRGLLSFPCC